MKAHAWNPGGSNPAALVGLVLCQNVRDPGGRIVLRKGEVLSAVSAGRLKAEARHEVHLLEMEPGELHETEAGRRLASAAAGQHVAVRVSAGGQWAIVAERRGLLGVDVASLAAVNALEGVGVFTLFHDQAVDVGEVVARAKVTPLVVAEAVVREAEARARETGGVVTVRPFRPLAVAAIAPAAMNARGRARFRAALEAKLAWLGAAFAGVEFAGPEPAGFEVALGAALAGGAEVVLAAGANLLDPLDPLLGALERLGGRMVRRGAPADPGSLLWLAHLGETPVLGVTSCAMFSQGTLVDLVLPRLLAGDALGLAQLAALGHGGLLTREMAFRFPPYRSDAGRGTVGS